MPIIIESLFDIFNLSIATGDFPDNWKTARGAPIFKSRQANNRSNYRKLIYNQFYELTEITCFFQAVWV